ncbi:hypothetical protein [Kineococcus auxinigenes]|uniref:hypothetical protein n=1 Tax=unclassified Kineococcus TaxID=2621656 RepID=UPI003D7EBAB0
MVLLVLGLSACGQDPAATWRLAQEPDPQDVSVSVLVSERACSSGRTAEGRIQEPEVEYRREEVVITVRVDALDGANSCPGAPETPFTVELSEPIGTRALVDGGQAPAATVSPPG